ncbi:MAG: polysaccharide biosynthesis/export family protein [Candidatus Solibacter sp.]
MKLAALVLVLSISGFGQRPTPMADPATTNLPAQKIGPDDLLAVSVYDAPELTRTVRVGADGTIRIPMLKQRLKVDGLMPGDVESAIAAALVAEELLVGPFVTVTVAEYHSRPISVMGAVRKPITFQAETPVTLLHALARAEGLNSDAGQEILISKAARSNSDSAPLVQRISVKALIDGADPSANLTLTGGEEVRVPEAGRIYVVGNVKKPGAFTIQDNSQSTVLKALAMAEGLSPYAGKQAFIYRTEGGVGGKNEIPVELRLIMERKTDDVALLPNDILYITDNKSRRLTITTLEKIFILGAGVTSALIYAGVH